MADPRAGTAMTSETPVRIASNTKTFVAASVLRLAEAGKLDIDDPISKHLPAEPVALLAGDGYRPDEMTIRHLLTHTSGLFDHTSGEEYARAITSDPMHRWTPLEQLRLAVRLGAPHGPPGELYTYCDTGYVLLGQIIEAVTGQNLAQAVRALVGFDRLGLDATWWEILEPAPAGIPKKAHHFLGELDCTDFDPSYDLYGGGGLVASMPDLARFFRALFAGKVFEHPATLQLMLTGVAGLRAIPGASAKALPPGVYRMGIWTEEIGGHQVWRHSGFWGTSAVYVPDLDAVITCTVNQNQNRGAMDRLTARAIAIVADAMRAQLAGTATSGQRRWGAAAGAIATWAR